MRIGIDASRAFVKDPTGTERYSYEVITRILKLPEAKKHTWILYTRNSPPAAADPSLNLREGKGVSYKRINLPFLWTQVGLAWRTWIDKLDILWVPAHTLPLLRRGFGGLGGSLRTVVTIHGIEYEWLPAYENLLQRWYLPLSTKYAVHSATKIIAVSEFTKRQLVERLGARTDKIEVIYEGVALIRRGLAGTQGHALRKWRLKFKRYVLFVGTVQPRKNLVRLIEAFSRLDARRYTLVIAGKLGWMYDEVLAAPKKWGVENKVVFTGYINEAERNSLLRNALVYVQPSITEGFGLPVLEAMAFGVPVVLSNGGALPEILNSKFEDPKNISMFDPYDVSDICHKLSLVIGSHSLRKELIRKGRQRIKQFTWQKAAKRTYNNLISKH